MVGGRLFDGRTVDGRPVPRTTGPCRPLDAHPGGPGDPCAGSRAARPGEIRIDATSALVGRRHHRTARSQRSAGIPDSAGSQDPALQDPAGLLPGAVPVTGARDSGRRKAVAAGRCRRPRRAGSAKASCLVALRPRARLAPQSERSVLGRKVAVDLETDADLDELRSMPAHGGLLRWFLVSPGRAARQKKLTPAKAENEENKENLSY